MQIELNKCFNENAISTLKRMPDDFLDLTVTSPPYDSAREYKNKIDKTWGKAVWEPIISELYRVTKPGGVVVWVVGDMTVDGSETLSSFKQALFLKECGFNIHDTMIYYRTTPFPSNVRYNQVFEYMFVASKGKPNTFNHAFKQFKTDKTMAVSHPGSYAASVTYRDKDGKTRHVDKNGMERIALSQSNKLKTAENIWYYSVGYMNSTKDKYAFEHPAIFPEQLAADHIDSWSKVGDIVYDPFAGSGTTLKMAKLLGRSFLGSEISEEYHKICTQRVGNVKNIQNGLF